MISKETFVKAIRLIQEQDEINRKVENALSLVGNGHYVFGTNSKDRVALLAVLKEAVGDTWDYIGWWLYEAAPEYKVWSDDETKEWCLKDPAALYDFIVNEC